MTPNPIDLEDAITAEPRGSVGAASPCTIVIFGASGDLTQRKLIPALYELAPHKSLAQRFAVISFGRTPMSDDHFSDSAAEAVRKNSESGPVDEDDVRKFAQSFAYVAGEYNQPEGFQKLAQRIEELDLQYNLEGNRLYYLATPPNVTRLGAEQI